MDEVKFEWDEDKAASNFAKHNVSFDEAKEVFADPNALEGYDAAHSIEEHRFFIIGLSSRRLLFVVFAERHEDIVRLISARRPTLTEKELYEEDN